MGEILHRIFRARPTAQLTFHVLLAGGRRGAAWSRRLQVR